LHFFLLPTASSFFITSLSGWGGWGCTAHGRGGRGDARASCASPLGTPLLSDKFLGKKFYNSLKTGPNFFFSI
jgi:hypothetical protein